MGGFFVPINFTVVLSSRRHTMTSLTPTWSWRNGKTHGITEFVKELKQYYVSFKLSMIHIPKAG
jgi:hypothetical protein